MTMNKAMDAAVNQGTLKEPPFMEEWRRKLTADACSTTIERLTMDDAQVERVARAICKAEGCDPDWTRAPDNRLAWKDYVDAARAATAAMPAVDMHELLKRD